MALCPLGFLRSFKVFVVVVVVLFCFFRTVVIMLFPQFEVPFWYCPEQGVGLQIRPIVMSRGFGAAFSCHSSSLGGLTQGPLHRTDVLGFEDSGGPAQGQMS